MEKITHLQIKKIVMMLKSFKFEMAKKLSKLRTFNSDSDIVVSKKGERYYFDLTIHSVNDETDKNLELTFYNVFNFENGPDINDVPLVYCRLQSKTEEYNKEGDVFIAFVISHNELTLIVSVPPLDIKSGRKIPLCTILIQSMTCYLFSLLNNLVC